VEESWAAKLSEARTKRLSDKPEPEDVKPIQKELKK